MLQKVTFSNLGLTNRPALENSLSQPSRKWNEGRIRQRKKKGELRNSYAVPKI